MAWPSAGRGAGRLALVPTIRPPSFRRASSIGALGLAVLTASVPGLGRAAPGEPAPSETVEVQRPTTAPAEYERRIAEGDRLIAEGKPAEGAQALSDGYLVMPPEQRMGEPGRIVVSRACNAYEAAWQAGNDPVHLRDNRVLLQAYFADLEDARTAGQATVPADAQEQALRERLEGIEQLLADLEARTETPAAEAPAPAPELEPELEPQVEVTFPPPDPRLRRNALILLGVGGVGLVAGGVMVITGAVAASRAEEARRSATFEDAGDARSTKIAGTILATTGALVFSGSVMMLGVGSNRLADFRRANDQLALSLSVRPTLGGMVLRGRF